MNKIFVHMMCSLSYCLSIDWLDKLP